MAAALGALILAASCKKEEDTALPSLTGSLNIQGVPAYVSPQDEVTFKINRITHPEGGNIGYAYSITEGYMTTKDTLDAGEMTFTYKFCDRKNFEKDTLRTVTVSAYAFADGYYTTYSSSYPVNIVKGGVGADASIQGIEAGTTEVIDGITYYTCTVNGKTWLSRNLVRENFLALFDRCLSQYGAVCRRIGVVGGFGAAMKDVFLEIAALKGVSVGVIEASPVEGLVRYHSQD